MDTRSIVSAFFGALLLVYPNVVKYCGTVEGRPILKSGERWKRILWFKNSGFGA